MPLTYAVSLLEGIWKGDAWSAHMGDLAALAVVLLRLHGALGESFSMGIAQTSSPPFAAPGQRPTAPESAAQPPSPDQRAYRRREVPLHMDGYATYQALRFQQRLDSSA